MDVSRSHGAGLVAGVLAGVGTYAVAGWPDLALWNAVAFAGAVGLLIHASESLWPHLDSSIGDDASIWHAGSGAAVGVGVATVVTVLDLPLGDRLVVGAFVGAVAIFAYAAGIATTLSSLRRSDALSGERRTDGRADP